MFIQVNYKAPGFGQTFVNVIHIAAVFDYNGTTHIRLTVSGTAEPIEESVDQILEAIRDAAQ
jgi:hypothetical protein